MESNQQGELAGLVSENAQLRASLRDLLDVYWGSGDGREPPEFIARAASLCGYPLKGSAA